MRTVYVDQKTPIEPRTLYINATPHHLTLDQGCLHVSTTPPSPDLPTHRPIDHFLTSLAESPNYQAIAIILSGTGSDGILGIRNIKARDGIVLVQDTASATCAELPRHALATGAADAVMSPEHMPSAILGAISPSTSIPTTAFGIDESDLAGIATLLGPTCPVDIRLYRRTTLHRRLHRRMMLTQTQEVSAYIARLRTSPEERNRLVQDLLINVTRFFRDPEAYDVLAQHVIPTLLNRMATNEAIRIWVTACSTGEEAYSIAMLLREQLDQSSNPNRQVRLFATDVDREALAVAARGCYPERIAEDISAERLARFFIRHDTGYQVARSLRDMVIFAPHDLTQEPPFTQMDLISCRNCLIYLEPNSQHDVLALLGGSLRSQGYLWLGPSESIDPIGPYFHPVQHKWRIFQNMQPVPPYHPQTLTVSPRSTPPLWVPISRAQPQAEPSATASQPPSTKPSATYDGDVHLSVMSDALQRSNAALHAVQQELAAVNQAYQSQCHEWLTLHHDIEHLLQSTLNLHPHRIGILDSDGRLIFANQAWRDVASTQTLPGFCDVGRNYLEMCDQTRHWREAPRIASGIRQLLQLTSEAFDLHYAHPGPIDKHWFHLQVRRLGDSAPPQVVLIHEEITERRQLLQKASQHAHDLAETQRLLAERNSELSELTHAMHHDLQEPLRQVVTFSQLLQQHLADTLEWEAEESLGFVINGTQRMLALVQHLTDFAHVGRVELRRERSALSACVQDVLKRLNTHIEASGAEVVVEGLPDVMGDRAMLTQLYQNLIGNAIKFASQRRLMIHLTAERHAKGWLMGVRDNGIGIDPLHAQQLFAPFKRLHGRGQYDGCGLGLAICRRIVQRHGGDIWADLNVEVGAYLKFTLPDDHGH